MKAEYPCCFRCGVLILSFTPLERCPGCGGPLSALELEDAPPSSSVIPAKAGIQAKVQACEAYGKPGSN